MTFEKLTLSWNNRTISIEYNSNSFPAFKEIQGFGMAQLRIQSEDEKPLPISQTGFRSRFISDNLIQEFGGAVQYVEAWLDDSAKKDQWKKYVVQSQQLKLF